MRQVSDTIYRKPRLSLAAATVFVLLLASILVPVRTAPPGGYEVAFAAPVGSLVLNPENAEKMLAALDITDAGIESRETDSGVQYRNSSSAGFRQGPEADCGASIHWEVGEYGPR